MLALVLGADKAAAANDDSNYSRNDDDDENENYDDDDVNENYDDDDNHQIDAQRGTKKKTLNKIMTTSTEIIKLEDEEVAEETSYNHSSTMIDDDYADDQQD